MCGIFGSLNGSQISDNELLTVEKMLSKRGPDGGNTVLIDDVLLHHSRLAFVEIGAKGQQPYKSSCGNYLFVYNGEIYNVHELKEKYEKLNLKSNSDTELLCELLITYGLSGLDQVDGMYAFALFDREKKEVTLGRDPMGMKPLYYNTSGNSLRFSSSLDLVVNNKSNICEIGKKSFLMFGYTIAPFTLYEEVKQLRSGELLTYSMSNRCVKNIERRRYDLFKSGPTKNIDVKHQTEVINLSLREHLKSEVEVGSLLSGGLDSSLLSAMSSKIVPNLKCISISFSEDGFDEGYYQKKLIKSLDDDVIHFQKKYSYSEFKNDYFKYLDLLEFPIIDGFNSYLVTKEVKNRSLKGVISGQGSDEIFYGYKSFKKFSKSTWYRDLYYYFKYYKACANVKGYRTKVLIAQYLSAKLYFPIGDFTKSHSDQKSVNELVLEIVNSAEFLLGDKFENFDNLQVCSALELSCRLSNELMIKDDFFAMQNSIEVRNPFLSKRILEFFTSLSSEIILAKGHVGQKKLLQVIAEAYVPDEVIYRRKVGFSVPYRVWLPKLYSNYSRTKSYAQNLISILSKRFFDD